MHVIHIQKEIKLTSARRPLQVVPVEALYIQSFSIFKKLKTKYNNCKILVHLSLVPSMFTANEI